jgi:hypothetical protein
LLSDINQKPLGQYFGLFSRLLAGAACYHQKGDGKNGKQFFNHCFGFYE